MQVALAHDWLTNYAGSEQLLFYLHQIYPHSPIFTTLFNQNKVTQFSQVPVITSWLQKVPYLDQSTLIPLMPWAINWNFEQFDLILSDSAWAMKGLKLPQKTKHICLLLTPTRYLWKIGGDTRAYNPLTLPLINLMKRWDFQAAQRPTVLVAISKTVQSRIKEFYHRESKVIYPPVEVERFKVLAEEKIEDYFLSVGRLVSYKRVDLIIDAFNQLKYPLKIIGTGPLENILKKQALPNIEFLGNLDNSTRDKYYQKAKGFIFAAEEDFGIVPVEAMAAGRPVIAFGKGGATETVKEDVSGLFFSEQTVKSLVDAVGRFNKINFHPRTISKSVAHFNPERFMKEVKNIISEVTR